MAPELSLPSSERPAPRSRLRARQRRSRGQRLLIGFGCILTVVALVGAGAVGWTAWKLRSVDRTDVSLDQREEDTGPSNYLIVGSDSRKGGDPLDPSAADTHNPLADTIMLLRIDRATEEARILSLPRDLWITLPSTGKRGRINAAYAKGPQELIDAVRTELDVPINHYIEVDFHGFQELVSAVGGVPMWFDRAMRDDNTGLDILHPGCINLDGRSALAFARARHLQYFSRGGFTYDGTGDLGRISRQQLFLRRTIDRVKDRWASNPLVLKRLIEAGTSNMTLDDELSVGELIAMANSFSEFDSDELDTYTLPNTPRTTNGGAQVVELARQQAEPILKRFRDKPARGSARTTTTLDPSSLLAPSAVTAKVLNSSGRSGLAVDVADRLVALGFEIDHFGNGSELGHASEPRTVVRHGAGAGAEARTLAARVQPDATAVEDTTLDEGEVVLFLGRDFTGLATSTGNVVVPDSDVTSTAPPGTAGADPGDDAATTTAATTTTKPPRSKVVGIVPGDPPRGKSCG